MGDATWTGRLDLRVPRGRAGGICDRRRSASGYSATWTPTVSFSSARCSCFCRAHPATWTPSRATWQVLSEFEREVISRSDKLRMSVVHDDANDQNVLVDDAGACSQSVGHCCAAPTTGHRLTGSRLSPGERAVTSWSCRDAGVVHDRS